MTTPLWGDAPNSFLCDTRLIKSASSRIHPASFLFRIDLRIAGLIIGIFTFSALSP